MQSKSKILKAVVDNILQVKVIGPGYAPLDVTTVAKDVLFLFYSMSYFCVYIISNCATFQPHWVFFRHAIEKILM